MAKVFYLLKQNKVKNSKVSGKWFARQKTIETLNTRKLANHISEHGSIYTPDVVFGVLEKFRSCLLEMLLNSKRVKIDGLGIFFTTLENTEGGAESKDKFLPQKNLKGLHIRFLPDSSTETDISSREPVRWRMSPAMEVQAAQVAVQAADQVAAQAVDRRAAALAAKEAIPVVIPVVAATATTMSPMIKGSSPVISTTFEMTSVEQY